MRIHIEGKDWSHMINTKDKVSDAAASARPYVERALRDKELRDNVRNAYTSARAVYDELASRRKVSDAATQLVADKDLQDEIRHAIGELRNAAGRVTDAKHGPSETGRAVKNGVFLIVGIAVGLLFNPITGPPLRRLLGRKLFGGGNGFEYQGNGSKK